MTITKCDCCKKIISKESFDREPRLRISVSHPFTVWECCDVCSAKILTILGKKFKLVVIK